MPNRCAEYASNSLPAAMGPVLHLLDLVALEDKSSFEEVMKDIIRSGMSLVQISLMFRMIPVHGRAYEAGIISVEVLVGVMAPPFLKVARAMNSTGPTPSSHAMYEQEMMRDMALKAWGDRIRNLLNADLVRSQLEPVYVSCWHAAF